MPEKNGESCLEQIVTLSDIAVLSGYGERHIQRLTRSGLIKTARDKKGRALRGRYVIGLTLPVLSEHTRDLAVANDPHEQLYAQSRAMRMRCAAESAALDLRLRQGELLDGALVDREVSNIMRQLRDNLRGLPAQLMQPLRAMDDAVLIRKTLKGAIDRVLHKTAAGDLSARLRREQRRHHETIDSQNGAEPVE
jgi:hypothetical protein